MDRPAAKVSALKLAGLYVGTVVGAGFASGQEVMQYFGFHGLGGMWGILTATALFVLYGAVVMSLGQRLQAASHREVVQASGIPWIGTVVDAVITFFLIGVFSTMAAGSGAVFEERFGVPHYLGSAVIVALTVVTVVIGFQGVITAVSFVTPFLLGSVVVVSLLAILNQPVELSWAAPERAAVRFWPLSAVTYASYNLVLAVPMLAPAGTLADRSTLRQAAVLGGAGLGLGALAIYLAMSTAVPEVAGWDVPMLFLAGSIARPLSLAYAAILLAEVYTTAVTGLYGFAARLADPKGPRFRAVVVASGVAGFAGSLLGFSELVAKVYAAVGFAGYTLLFTLIVAYFRTRTGTRPA